MLSYLLILIDCHQFLWYNSLIIRLLIPIRESSLQYQSQYLLNKLVNRSQKICVLSFFFRLPPEDIQKCPLLNLHYPPHLQVLFYKYKEDNIYQFQLIQQIRRHFSPSDFLQHVRSSRKISS